MNKKVLYGVILIILVNIFLVMQAEITPLVISSSNYQQKFFLTWFDDACFILVFPLHLLLVLVFSGGGGGGGGKAVEFNQDLRISTEALFHNHHQQTSPFAQTNNTLTKRIYWRLLLRVLLFTIPFTAATYFWVSAFYLTTPARLVAVCSSSVCFTYLFEILLLGERFKPTKLLAVALGMMGVLVICGFFWSWLGSPRSSTTTTSINSSSIGRNGDKRWLGDLYALGSAILTALSEVLYKKYFVPKGGVISLPLTNLVTTMIGGITILVFWIALPILHFTKVERFALPSDPLVFGIILLDAVFYVAFFNCSFISVALIGPVWTSLGSLFFTPVIATVDWVVYRRAPSWSVGVGALLITTAFFILVNDELGKERRKKEAKE